MKKTIMLIGLLITIGLAYTPFCSGFKAGYKEGYCYGKKYGCITPITPICPIPYLGENSWKDGYNRGFLLGLAAQ